MEFDFENYKELSEEEDIDLNEIFEVQEHIIFLIQYESLSFINAGYKLSNQQTFYDMLINTTQRKYLQNQNNKIGIIVYNSGSDQYRIIQELQNVNPSSFQSLKDFEKVLHQNEVKKSNKKIKQETKNECQQKNSFNFALEKIHSLFQGNLKKENIQQLLYIFTIDDTPYLEQSLLNKANKSLLYLKENLVQIQVFPMWFKIENFDFKKFYQEFLDLQTKNQIQNLSNKNDYLELLMKIPLQKSLSSRSKKLIRFTIYPECSLTICLLPTSWKLKMISSIPIDLNSQKILQKTTLAFNQQNELIPKEFQQKAFTLGQSIQPLSNKDQDYLRNYISEELVILGFKEKENLFGKTKNLNYILTLSEQSSKKESQLLHALWFQMEQENQMAFGRLKLKDCQTRVVYIVPSDRGENHFVVLTMPFEEDIRSIDYNEQAKESIKLTKKDLQVTEQLINVLTIENFQCSDLKNENVSRILRVLKNKANGKEICNNEKQITIFDKEFLKQIKEEVDEFKNHFQL